VKDITLLKEALPYLRHHKTRTMVVKLGGEVAADPQALRSLAEDLSLLAHVSIRIVVVHGGGPQATEMSKRLGLEPVLVGGRRVTDEATLDVAKMVFAGKINTDILSALRRQGVRAVGLSGVDGDVVHASKRPPTPVRDAATGEERVVDYGHVGDIRSVDTSLLRLLLENGYLPVIASLGSDADGNILNINADTVAAAIAKDLRASKLLILTSVPGLLRDKDDPETLVSRITTEEARAAMKGGGVAGGMLPKLAALVDAVEGGVERGHVLSGKEPGALLLELFTSAGAGTLVAEPGDEAEFVGLGPRG
jgi:acetylglutamate kinase